VVRGAEGRQYRVVAVDETENNEFADPPRKWGRVGIMAGAWALALALGGWAAPGIAASGNPENVDPREEPITDAIGAAWSYLEYGSTEDLDLAEAAICEGASPEVTPSDLDDLRQTHDADLGGIERINVNVVDPVPVGDGTRLTGTVSYVYQGNQPSKDFFVTVQERDGVFCVSNAVSASEEEQPSPGEQTSEAVDPQELATEFMRTIVIQRNAQTASALQCATYTGITPEELDAAIAEWGATNGEPTTFLNEISPTESSETSITAFEIEVGLDGGLNLEYYPFVVGVQEDCISSLEGGDGLI